MNPRMLSAAAGSPPAPGPPAPAPWPSRAWIFCNDQDTFDRRVRPKLLPLGVRIEKIVPLNGRGPRGEQLLHGPIDADLIVAVADGSGRGSVSRVQHVANDRKLPFVRVTRKTRVWQRSLRLARGFPEPESLRGEAPESPGAFPEPRSPPEGACPVPGSPPGGACPEPGEPPPGSLRALVLRAPAPAAHHGLEVAMESSTMEESVFSTFGPALAAARHDAGNKQDDVAALLSVPKSTVSRLENDKCKCKVSWYGKLVAKYPGLRDQPKPELQDDTPDASGAVPTTRVKESSPAPAELTFESAAEALAGLLLAAGALEEDVGFTHNAKTDAADLTLGAHTYTGTLIEVIRAAGPELKERVAALKHRSTRAHALLEKVPAACT